jgi:hypothetical protein
MSTQNYERRERVQDRDSESVCEGVGGDLKERVREYVCEREREFSERCVSFLLISVNCFWQVREGRKDFSRF